MNSSEKFWDRAAKTYDQSEASNEQTLSRAIEKTKKHLKSNDVVLDFGCGTGRVSTEISGQVKVIHAIDTSSNMIEMAKGKAAGRRIENIVYAHSTIFDERYESGSFDAILVFYTLHLLDDMPKVMQRIDELLKPGGLIISATPCVGEKKTLRGILSLAGKIGLVPKIKSFKVFELEDLIADGKFEIIEAECLQPRTQEYFMVAKRR